MSRLASLCGSGAQEGAVAQPCAHSRGPGCAMAAGPVTRRGEGGSYPGRCCTAWCGDMVSLRLRSPAALSLAGTACRTSRMQGELV